MRNSSIFIACICFFVSYALLWWPLAIVGLLCLILSGNWPLALIASLCFDFVWGRPAGIFHILLFPWSFLTALLLIIRYVVLRQIRSQMPEYL